MMSVEMEITVKLMEQLLLLTDLVMRLVQCILMVLMMLLQYHMLMSSEYRKI